MSLVKHELLTLQFSSTRVFSEVSVDQSLIFYVLFYRKINVRENGRGNEEFIETSNVGYTRNRTKTNTKNPTQKTKMMSTAQGWTSLYAYIQKNHNKTQVFLQITGSKDEPNIVFMRKS